MYGYLHYINIWDTHKKTVVEWKIGLCWGLLYESGNVAEFLKQCVSFRNSATVGRLLQVQSCNEQVDQSVDDMTGLKRKSYHIDLFKSCMELCNIILFTIAGFTLSYARYGKPRSGYDVMQLHARI